MANAEDVRQIKFLTTAPGEILSGLTRYAAAMYFFGQGRLSAAALEAYRTCSPLDGEDPVALLRSLGLDGEVRALIDGFTPGKNRAE